MNTMFKRADFQNAEWISAKGKYKSPLFRKKFTVSDIKTATVLIGCFGMFEAYLNGNPVSDELFGTPNTDFHKRDKIEYGGMPFNEELGHRLYCPEYDVTPLIREGENVLSF